MKKYNKISLQLQYNDFVFNKKPGYAVSNQLIKTVSNSV